MFSGILENEQQNETRELVEEPFDLIDRIVLQKEHDNKRYYVIKIHFTEEDLHKDNIYIARITEKAKKYRFERCSAFFSLNTPGEIPDIEYAPYGQFNNIEVDSLVFAVGKIYDSDYVPYLEGEVLKQDKEGIYAAVGKNSPVIEVKKKNI